MSRRSRAPQRWAEKKRQSRMAARKRVVFERLKLDMVAVFDRIGDAIVRAFTGKPPTIDGTVTEIVQRRIEGPSA